MDGLEFQAASPPVASDPARADIACFVGFVAPRRDAPTQRERLRRILVDLGWVAPSSGTPLPESTRVLPEQVRPTGDSSTAFPNWLRSLGWTQSPSGVAPTDLFRRAAAELLDAGPVEWWTEYGWLSPLSGRPAADLLDLFNVPVPIDTWDSFDRLFAWDRRPLVPGRLADTTIGAAVRRFFLQGGRKCYVVRVGDPWPLFTDATTRFSLRARLLEDVPPPSPVDRTTWRGVAHLYGLADVSFLCTPDLPELCAVEVGQVGPETEGEGEERFIECATRETPPTSRSLRAFPDPRCDDYGYRAWASIVTRIGRLLQGYPQCREVQFIAAVPLPADEIVLRRTPEFVTMQPAVRTGAVARRAFASRTAQWDAVKSIQTAFVQLAYPWLYTRESPRLPGAVESPDAMLAGVLANNALTLGTWRSMSREPVFGVTDLEPTLSPSELDRPLLFHGSEGQRRVSRTLRDRVSVFAPTPKGFQLLSDVTTDDDEAYRPANVNRLVASIVRAARLSGESSVFMNNGEALWRRLRSALEALLHGLWGVGALAGASSKDAFEVRCDRSTMTQADLDAGRAIARVQFTAASPVERITVVLAMDEGGQVTLA